MTMTGIVSWENRPSTTSDMIEEFKVLYADHSISVESIAENFKVSGATVTSIAKRLGLPLRRPKIVAIDAQAGSSLASVEAQIALIEGQLEELKRHKQDLEVRVVREGSTLTIYGMNEPITRSVLDVVYWLKAGGPAKLREKIRQEEWDR